MQLTTAIVILSGPIPVLLDAMACDIHCWSDKAINLGKGIVSLTYILEGHYPSFEDKLNALVPYIDMAALEDRGCKLISIR